MSAAEPSTVAARTIRRRVAVDWPNAAFAAVLALGAIIVVAETSGMSFFADDWDFVLNRRGLSAYTLLTPHGPHLSVVPILVFKVLLAVFGAGSYLPFRLLAAFDLVVCGLALGVACRDRWGRWWGLVPVLLLVTLGPGAVTILWPFQDGYSLAIAFGILSLIALDRGGPRSDLIACVALVISLGSASQGIGFVVGAAFVVVLRGNWRRRAWVVVVPAVLYVLWYATYGHQYSETHLSLWGGSLDYAMQSLSATAGALVGLTSVSTQTGILDTTFGVPIAVALVTAVAAAAWRGWRPRWAFWGAAATLVVVWFAASVSDFGQFSRPPTDPRYLSSDAALLLICVCAAIPRPRLGSGGVLVALIVIAAVCLTNADQYGVQRHSFDTGSRLEHAEISAVALMEGTVAPTYSPSSVDPNLADVTAQNLRGAIASFGLSIESPSQITAQPDATRDAVDQILAQGELSFASDGAGTRGALSGGGSGITALSGSPGHAHGCLLVGDTALEVTSLPGTVEISTSGRYPAIVTARRFAPTYQYGVGTVPAGDTATVDIQRDLAPNLPWRFSLTGTGSRVCWRAP